MNLRIARYILWGLVLALAIFFYINNQSKFTPVVDRLEDAGSHTAIAIGGPFELTNQHGQTVKSTDFTGRYMLIYFGYAFCPDICPLGLQNITNAIELLKRDRSEIVPIFITVDPTRDTVESLKLYASNFHSNFVMLTGSVNAIDDVKKLYKVFAERVDTEKATDYLMDHTTMIYLMDREGKFMQFFPHSTPPKDLARGIEQALLKEQKDKANDTHSVRP